MKHPRRQPLAETAARPGRAFVREALLIFACALAVRLIHIWQIRRAPFFDVLMGDARGYDAWGQRIANGDWLGHEVFYQAPLYPYFLGAIYTIAGRSLLAVRICQAIIGSAACTLLGLTAWRLFSRGAGLIAGLALALYAPAIFFDGLMQKSVLDVFFVCLGLWLLSGLVAAAPGDRSKDDPGPRGRLSWLWLGLAMGGLSLTRENAIVLVGVILLWALVRKEPARFIEAATFLLGLAIVLAPVAIRNHAVGGGFYLTTSQFGPNLYIGNNPSADGTYMSLRYGRGAPEYERQDATDLAEHAMGRPLTPSEVSGYWTDRAMGFITSRPGAWLKLVGRKFVLLWNADEALDTESQESHAEWSTPLRGGAWFGNFGILVPLALFGAFVAWPDRHRLWVFYVLALAYAASVIIFYVFARYRFPLVPFLVLFAAQGIVSARPFLATSPPRRRIAALATVLVAAILANWPVLSKTMMRAVTESNLAVALQEEGRIDEALTHYRRSIGLRADYAPAYSNMGVALRANGRMDDAVAAYERALAVQPDYPDAHYNLANALLDENKPDEAAEHFRIALRSIPGSAGAHNNLGIALAAEGKLDEAVEQFREALRAEPDSAKTNRNLGNVLSSMGRHEEGIGYLRRAVQLDPGDSAAHYDLGSDFLELNQLPEAAAEFVAALKLAPNSSVAHNNLGIALASEGRLDEAMDHFRQALAIQPDFADAERNLTIAEAQKKGGR
jgi:tetratricopeptide (TPR) repeat protein